MNQFRKSFFSRHSSLYLLPWIFITIICLALELRENLLFPLFFLNVWCLSYTHNISTYRRYDFSNIFSLKTCMIIFIIIMTVLIAIYQNYGGVILFNIYFYWQWFHYIKQNEGIMKLVSRRKKCWSDNIVNVLFPYMGLAHLWSRGDFDFFGYIIFTPQVPFLTTNRVSLIIYGLAFTYVIDQYHRYLRKEVTEISFISGLSNLLIIYLSYIFIENFYLGWILINIYHNVQYLLIINIFNQSKSDPKKESFYLFYFQTFFISTLIFGLLHIVLSRVNFSYLPLALIGGVALNFLHYFIDGRIWKRKNMSSLIKV